MDNVGIAPTFSVLQTDANLSQLIVLDTGLNGLEPS